MQSLENGSVGGNLLVHGSGANDTFNAPSISVGKSARLSLGNGLNTVTLDDAEIRGDLSVSTGSGDDHLYLDGSLVGGKKSIHLGSGNNVESGD